MTSLWSRRLFLSALGVLPLAAASFWDEKKYTEWTDGEVDRLLTDSPWSKPITATFHSQGARGPGGAGGMGRGGGGGMGRGGGMRGRGGGIGPGAPGGAGRGGGSAGPAGMPPLQATLRWTGALPIRQALLRRRLNASSEAKDALSREDTHYVLTLSGLSEDMARMGQDHVQSGLRSNTSLARKGKPPIRPQTVEFSPQGDPTSVIFRFPKDDPIRLEDKEVEFVSRIGPYEFKHKFRLKDMTCDGSLAL